MKKIFSLLLLSCILFNVARAQEEEDKNVRFGMKVAAIPTWLRSNDKKLYANGNPKFGFGFGLMLEFKITNVVKFATGIGGEFLGGEQVYKSDYGYILNGNDFYAVSQSDYLTDYSNTSKNYYVLKSRKIKTTYVTLPVALKMMTKAYSGMRFFGSFGGDIALLTRAKANDEVLDYKAANSAKTNSDMNIYKETIPVRVNLNVGIGMEYNISGSTSLMVSVNYMRSFLNLYRNESKYISKDFEKQTSNYIISGANPGVAGAKQGAFVDGIAINVGVLF
jgi:hypothetical protein